ncbi:MAG: divalent-cation tolerance protein CutA [Nanoarchaeota archaeon]|nr:divalent-cation tolerance protein CutA [Nanoarchaeota archaeon]
MSFIICYITVSDEKEALKIVNHLVEKRIVACGNIFPIKSAFWWKGEIKNTDEFVTIVKTKEENWEKVKEEVKKIHSYDVPCIMKIKVEANEDYEKWLNGEVGK